MSDFCLSVDGWVPHLQTFCFRHCRWSAGCWWWSRSARAASPWTSRRKSGNRPTPQSQSIYILPVRPGLASPLPNHDSYHYTCNHENVEIKPANILSFVIIRTKEELWKKRNYLWPSQSQWEVKTVLSCKLALVKLTKWQTRDIFYLKLWRGYHLKLFHSYRRMTSMYLIRCW